MEPFPTLRTGFWNDRNAQSVANEVLTFDNDRPMVHESERNVSIARPSARRRAFYVFQPNGFVDFFIALDLSPSMREVPEL